MGLGIRPPRLVRLKEAAPRAILISLVAGLLWKALGADEAVLTELHMSASTSWSDRGFVEMVPPIASPTSEDGSDQIEVWLKLPPGRNVDAVEGADGRPVLELPPGTVADRVEREVAASGSRIVDVRGTAIEADHTQRFHLLRPSGSFLRGFEWTRGSAEEQAAADRDIAHLVPHRAVTRLRRFNDCASCHTSFKPEQEGPADPWMPSRRTDAVGFYHVQAVLDDEQPLEAHRPRDTNLGEPFVTVSCRTGDAPRKEDGGRVVCPDRSVPRAHYDLRAALASDTHRAMRVCASRRYLRDHMTDRARAAFRAALAECRLDDEDSFRGRPEGDLAWREDDQSWTRRASK